MLPFIYITAISNFIIMDPFMLWLDLGIMLPITNGHCDVFYILLFYIY